MKLKNSMIVKVIKDKEWQVKFSLALIKTCRACRVV
jgi:hypothetical protein